MKKRILSIIMALAMVLAFMPAMTFADDGGSEYTQITINGCTKIGEKGGDTDIYYYYLGNKGTKVQFSDLEMEEDYSFIHSIGNYGDTLEGTNIVDLEDFDLKLATTYEELQEKYGENLDENVCKNLDFSNIYAVYVFDDNADKYVFVIQGVSRSFSFDIGQLTGMDKDAVDYEDWSNWPDVTTGYMDQYHVAVPTGTEQIKLSFTDDRICYAYDKDGQYLYSCADYGDGTTGSESATVTALEDGSMPAYIYVQTPYVNNKSDFLYAISFEQYTFTATYNGTELTNIEFTPDAYTYYDYINEESRTVGVYTVEIPEGAEAVDFTVSKPVLHYNYTKDGTYLGGAVADPTNGDTTFTQSVDYGDSVTPADGEFDYIQMQVPYDAAWNSTLLFAVTFKYKKSEDISPQPEKAKVEKGKTYKVNGASYKVTKVGATVTFTKAANKKSVSVPKTVKLKDGKAYKVTAVGAKAFTGKKIRTVTIGANVSKLAKGAFSKSRAKTMVLKTKKLKKKTVKGSLKGSKINTIKVKVGSKKLNKKYKKAYKKIFTKKNAGKKVKKFK